MKLILVLTLVALVPLAAWVVGFNKRALWIVTRKKEALSWISNYGSDRLKAAVASGTTNPYGFPYFEERIALEMPGWEFSFSDVSEFEASNVYPTTELLALLALVRANGIDASIKHFPHCSNKATIVTKYNGWTLSLADPKSLPYIDALPEIEQVGG